MFSLLQEKIAMFTWMLLSTDWMKFNVAALFERCQDGEWFDVSARLQKHTST